MKWGDKHNSFKESLTEREEWFILHIAPCPATCLISVIPPSTRSSCLKASHVLSTYYVSCPCSQIASLNSYNHSIVGYYYLPFYRWRNQFIEVCDSSKVHLITGSLYHSIMLSPSSWLPVLRTHFSYARGTAIHGGLSSKGGSVIIQVTKCRSASYQEWGMCLEIYFLKARDRSKQ